MVSARRVLGAVGVLMAAGLLFPREAAAYLDPGSGSYVLQLAVAGALAAAYMLKLYWRKLWARVGRVVRRAQGSDEHAG